MTKYNKENYKKALPKFFKFLATQQPRNLSKERWETYIDRSKQVIELRIQDRSLKEVAELMEISRERARQIEIDIVGKIKKFLAK
jgi:DNA-directed RNA polymerase sigma subunit (sigma70/sigma32)